MPTLSKSKIMLGCGAAHIIPWALFCAFLTLYVSLKRSSPAAKCSSCEADLCNQTRKQPAQTACLEKCPDVLEEAQRGYREENDKLSALLAQADRSMTDLQIHLHTCQMQLKNLEDNVTAGVAEASIHEVEKRIVLEGGLSLGSPAQSLGEAGCVRKSRNRRFSIGDGKQSGRSLRCHSQFLLSSDPEVLRKKQGCPLRRRAAPGCGQRRTDASEEAAEGAAREMPQAEGKEPAADAERVQQESTP